MAIPSSLSLIFEVKSTGSELAFGRLRQTSDVFGRLRTSSGIFGNDRVVFKNPSTPRIKISRLFLRKSWQVYKSSSEQILFRKYCRWVPLLYMPLQCCKGFAFDSYNNFSKKARKRVTADVSTRHNF